MGLETMNANERLEAAIRLEQPDRVPVVPYMTGEPLAALTGLTNAEISSNSALYCAAGLAVLENYGGWDGWVGGPFTPDQIQVSGIFPLRMRVPGRELPERYMYQIHEEEVLQFADYQRLCEMGFYPFFNEDYLWRITSLNRQQVDQEIELLALHTYSYLAKLNQRGVPYFSVNYALHPFFMLSLMRSMIRFTEDLYYRPAPVERALDCLTNEMIPRLISVTETFGVRRVQIVEERASTYTYPLAVFERFWWPYTERIVDALWSEGIVTYFHLDTPWTRNLPYFKRLPRGSFVVGLDSTTDIFAAKQILNGHAAIYGDVPASLLSIGSEEGVRDYVRKLIDEVGAGGGFILGTGCSAPPELKPELFRAFIETGKTYELTQQKREAGRNG